jgi:hypothetical protein
MHVIFPEINGKKKPVDSISERARREVSDEDTAILYSRYFLLFREDGKAAQLIKYESSLASKPSWQCQSF